MDIEHEQKASARKVHMNPGCSGHLGLQTGVADGLKVGVASLPSSTKWTFP